MKKILPLLLLLLLLIIYCVWSKKDNIHLTSTSQAQAISSPAVAKEIRHIDYVIAQNDKGYTLNGNFTNTQQQARFMEIFGNAEQTLIIEHTATNETLLGDRIIEFTTKILPHFIQNYSKGKIVYQEEKLTITGTANSYEAQHEMQRLLNTSMIASQDNSSVFLNKPITYSIHKDHDTLNAKGTFNDHEQVLTIKKHLPSHTSTHFNLKPHHIDKDSLKVIDIFLPFFIANYTQGDIIYENEKLTVSGMVGSEAEVEKVQALLAHASVPVINHTKVDPDLLAKAQEEAKKAEAARLAALEVERQAQLDAAKKVALEKEAKKALELEAAKRAEQEAKRQAEAKALKEKLALEAKYQAEAKAQEAKKAELKTKIANLLKLDNIEFNVNKSTLTQKGQETVDKLANILKEYTSVHIEIAGHTDSDGSAEYNQKLSQSRVDMVKSKLIDDAIDASRLTAKGYGETKPLVPNDTKENKAKNRRVEITILGE